MDKNERIYLKYLLEFYKNQSQGDLEGRPLSYLDYTGSESPSLLDDLVDIIEKIIKK